MNKKIAVIGWGSLIWNPEELELRGVWFQDGPILPIEFARFSERGRVTLVIVERKPEIRVLWALLKATSLDSAVANLAKRESVTKSIGRDIGRWRRGDPCSGAVAHAISTWAMGLGLDAVVWTALKHKVKTSGDRVPALREVIERLKREESKENHEPREYIMRTPKQVDTEYRRGIAKALGWCCSSGI